MDSSPKPPVLGAGGSSRWSVIVRAQGSGPEAKQALHELVQRYQGFIVRLIRHFRYPPDLTPEELKQEFVVWLLKGGINRFDGNRTFRGWIRSRVRGFLSDEWEKWRRRNQMQVRDFDIVEHSDPEHFWDAAFAWELLLDVLDRLRAEAPDPRRFDVLLRFLPGPQQDLVPYAPVAKSLGITATHLAKLVCELRAELKRALRESVADSLDLNLELETGDAVAREMRLLYRSLSETPSVDVLLEAP